VVQPRLGADVRQLAALDHLTFVLRIELGNALLGTLQQLVHARLALRALLGRAQRIVRPHQALDRDLPGLGWRPRHFAHHLGGGRRAQRLHIGQDIDELGVASAGHGHDVLQRPLADLQRIEDGQVVHAQQTHMQARCVLPLPGASSATGVSSAWITVAEDELAQRVGLRCQPRAADAHPLRHGRARHLHACARMDLGLPVAARRAQRPNLSHACPRRDTPPHAPGGPASAADPRPLLRLCR
jgi:hypothetical protein